MRKKLMKTMALVLSFVMICLNVDTKYIKAEDTDITIKNHGVNNAVEKPATLDAGQVWTNKDVVDHGMVHLQLHKVQWQITIKMVRL